MKLTHLQEAKYKGKYPEGTAGWLIQNCFAQSHGESTDEMKVYEINSPYHLMWTWSDSNVSFADVDNEGMIYFEHGEDQPLEAKQSVTDQMTLYVSKKVFGSD